MSTHKWLAPESAASALTTELNSLGSATKSAASAAITNETDLYQWMDLELYVTYGTAPVAGGRVDVYLLPRADGANYVDGDASTQPQAALCIGSFQLRAVTTAQRLGLYCIRIPSEHFKLIVDNQAGQPMAASGNTLKYRRYYEQDV